MYLLLITYSPICLLSLDKNRDREGTGTGSVSTHFLLPMEKGKRKIKRQKQKKEKEKKKKKKTRSSLPSIYSVLCKLKACVAFYYMCIYILSLLPTCLCVGHGLPVLLFSAGTTFTPPYCPSSNLRTQAGRQALLSLL